LTGDDAVRTRMGSALQQLRVLVQTGHASLAVSATAQILAVAPDLWTDDAARLQAARLAVGLFVVRFVNGFADAQQTGMYAQSVMELADRIGMPRLLVDVRHEAAHGSLPSVAMLRRCVVAAWEWLRVRYWVPQRGSVVGVVLEPVVPLPSTCTTAAITEAILRAMIRQRSGRDAGDAVPSLSSFTRSVFVDAAAAAHGDAWSMVAGLATPALCALLVQQCGASLTPPRLQAAVDAGHPVSSLLVPRTRPGVRVGGQGLTHGTASTPSGDSSPCTPATVAQDTTYMLLCHLALRVHAAVPQPHRRWAWLRHSVVEPSIAGAGDAGSCTLSRLVALVHVWLMVAAAMPSPLHHRAPVSPAVACIGSVGLQSLRQQSPVRGACPTARCSAALAPLSSLLDSLASSAVARHFRKALVAAQEASTGADDPLPAVMRQCVNLVSAANSAQGSSGSLLGELLHFAPGRVIAPAESAGAGDGTGPSTDAVLANVALWRAEAQRVAALRMWAARSDTSTQAGDLSHFLHAALSDTAAAGCDWTAASSASGGPSASDATSAVRGEPPSAVAHADIVPSSSASGTSAAAATSFRAVGVSGAMSIDDVEAWLMADAAVGAGSLGAGGSGGEVPPVEHPVVAVAVAEASVAADATADRPRRWMRLW